ncbi:MAG: Ribosomal large subunit pseudouridine synthase D [Chlamydiales bacterium]|nr:Ribosomal large subunit pseudouridine synthase D [Chlamydiales bacterium]
MSTLLESLERTYPDSSKRTLRSWIKWGRVSVDGAVVTNASTPLLPEQKIAVGKKEQVVEEIPILYEDRYLIVINKPSGLLSVPAENDNPSAYSLLKETYSICPVHRIDQDTSGTLLFARGSRSQEKFDALFEKHALEREYLAIIEGSLPQETGTWESYLREKENYDMEVTTPQEGKRAVTHFEVIRRSKKFSYLRLRLETGKKHQIRVHCREAGHPIVGDHRYGSLLETRLCLHAYRLSFVHPFTDKRITVTAPIPGPLKKLGLNE